jgi:hypothetical protein
MGGHGRVPHKRRFLAGIKETQTNIMVGAARREHECDLGMRELACHGEQSGVTLAVRVEHYGRRIAGEACGRKCVYLENTQGCLRSLCKSFARIRAPGYTSMNRRGGLNRPETREIECPIDLRTR